ncbi:hypothetical protein [Arthrobacter glacialis]|nr:hypothetical protein [Arthrobacter glacialis]
MSESYLGAPRPRVLVQGLTDEEIEIIRPLAGSLRAVESFYDVHAEEHDVLIITDANFTEGGRAFHRRIVFAAKPEPFEAGPYLPTSSGYSGRSRPNTKVRTQFKPSLGIEVTPFAREQGLESLVRRSCVPTTGATYTGFNTPVWPERTSHALVRERLSSPLTLAAFLERDNPDLGPDSALWLPDSARSALKEWVAFAFARWRSTEPDVFPESAEWMSSNDWASLDEIDLRRQLTEFNGLQARLHEQAENERLRLTDAIAIAEQEGQSWRHLISETGDQLVAAVKNALELFEFTVIDSDDLPQHKGKKREDLRVSDGDWIALVEVKGYRRAAKSNDLQQVSSASVAFAVDEGRAPDALWYVPNVYRDVDPAQREVALVGREDDLVAFGENHKGCLIDTRDLFALRQRVVLGQITSADARAELKTAVSRYSIDAGVSGLRTTANTNGASTTVPKAAM